MYGRAPKQSPSVSVEKETANKHLENEQSPVLLAEEKTATPTEQAPIRNEQISISQRQPRKKGTAQEKNRVVAGEKKKRRGWRIVLILLAVFILLAGIAYAMFAHYYSLLNVQRPEAEPEETIAPQAEDLEAADPAALEALKPDESWDFGGKDVVNILFIGVDNDDMNKMEKRGSADGQLLVSINNTTKQVVLTSFMRNLTIYIYDSCRMMLNRIYHYYGTERLLEAYEQNFNIHVDNYILLNYLDLIEIIDAFDGVTLEVRADEIEPLNYKIQNLNAFLGRPIPTDKLGETDVGVQTLNGVQTTAYLRIRMTAGGDAERTARLRKVIMQLKEKVQKMSIAELNDMATKILPIIKTDLSQATTLKLLTNAPSLLKYEFISQRVPIDGTWEYAGPSFVDMDFKKNNEYLYYTIYEGHAPD